MKLSKRPDLALRNKNSRKYEVDCAYFHKIDSEEKAYWLGFILAEAYISKNNIRIQLHRQDINLLIMLKNAVGKQIPIKDSSGYARLSICSEDMVRDICRICRLEPGAKSAKITIPKINKKYLWHFLRGFFDGDGHVTTKKSKHKQFICSMASISEEFRKQLVKVTNCGGKNYENQVRFFGNNAELFLDRLYKNATIKLKRKYDLYIYWKAKRKSFKENSQWHKNRAKDKILKNQSQENS
jgi:hypothetical protein